MLAKDISGRHPPISLQNINIIFQHAPINDLISVYKGLKSQPKPMCVNYIPWLSNFTKKIMDYSGALISLNTTQNKRLGM